MAKTKDKRARRQKPKTRGQKDKIHKVKDRRTFDRIKGVSRVGVIC